MLPSWIELAEYSEKYGVSMSTLRRRIRARQIEFKMEKGRYLLEDSSETIENAPLYARLGRAPVAQAAPAAPTNGPSLEALSQENRKLKAQISELETLVKVLEAELRTTGKDG